MEAERNQRLPLSGARQNEESHQKDAAMTKRGVYAAVSYMASAGSLSLRLDHRLFIYLFHFLLSASLL